MSSYFVDQQGNGWVPQMHLIAERDRVKMLEDAVSNLEATNKALYEFVDYISRDYFELSFDKIRTQRDDWRNQARKLLEELSE